MPPVHRRPLQHGRCRLLPCILCGLALNSYVAKLTTAPLLAVCLMCLLTSCVCRYNEGCLICRAAASGALVLLSCCGMSGSAAAAGPASAAAVQTWVNTLLVDRGVSFEVSDGVTTRCESCWAADDAAQVKGVLLQH